MNLFSKFHFFLEFYESVLTNLNYYFFEYSLNLNLNYNLL